ncbi:MAG: hypothetical protein ACJAYI_002332 [Myxococcota bacterium]
MKPKPAAVARVPAVRNQVRISSSGQGGNRGGTVGGFFPYQFIVGANLSVFIGFNWFFNDDMNGEFRVVAVRGRGAN